MTHICVSKLTIIGSDNGLSPDRHQAIIWTNAGILLIQTLRTNFSEISREIYTFQFKKMHLKMLSGKCRPSCLGLNELIYWSLMVHTWNSELDHWFKHWKNFSCFTSPKNAFLEHFRISNMITKEVLLVPFSSLVLVFHQSWTDDWQISQSMVGGTCMEPRQYVHQCLFIVRFRPRCIWKCCGRNLAILFRGSF